MVQEGTATFTAGGEVIEAGRGQDGSGTAKTLRLVDTETFASGVW